MGGGMGRFEEGASATQADCWPGGMSVGECAGVDGRWGGTPGMGDH